MKNLKTFKNYITKRSSVVALKTPQSFALVSLMAKSSLMADFVHTSRLFELSKIEKWPEDSQTDEVVVKCAQMFEVLEMAGERANEGLSLHKISVGWGLDWIAFGLSGYGINESDSLQDYEEVPKTYTEDALAHSLRNEDKSKISEDYRVTIDPMIERFCNSLKSVVKSVVDGLVDEFSQEVDSLNGRALECLKNAQKNLNGLNLKLECSRESLDEAALEFFSRFGRESSEHPIHAPVVGPNSGKKTGKKKAGATADVAITLTSSSSSDSVKKEKDTKGKKQSVSASADTEKTSNLSGDSKKVIFDETIIAAETLLAAKKASASPKNARRQESSGEESEESNLKDEDDDGVPLKDEGQGAAFCEDGDDDDSDDDSDDDDDNEDDYVDEKEEEEDDMVVDDDSKKGTGSKKRKKAVAEEDSKSPKAAGKNPKKAKTTPQADKGGKGGKRNLRGRPRKAHNPHGRLYSSKK